MAFTSGTLSSVSQTIGGDFHIFNYRTDDPVDLITSVDYFVDAEDFGVNRGDLIFVSPVSDIGIGSYVAVVETVDTSGNATVSVFQNQQPLDAVGDGVTNDAVAIQNWLDSNLDEHILPPRSYYCGNAILTITNRDIILRGVDAWKSQLVFDGAGGIVVSQNDIYQTIMEDFALIQRGSGVGQALSIAYSGSIDWPNNRFKHFVQLEDLFIGGETYTTDGWLYGIDLDNCSRTKARNITIRGQKDISQATDSEARWWGKTLRGIHYHTTTDDTPVTGTFENIDCEWCETGFSSRGRIEGIFLLQPQMVACKYGIVDDRTDVVLAPIDTDPLLHVIAGHMNCGVHGVRTINVSHAWVEGCLMYKFDQVDLAAQVIRMEQSNFVRVQNNNIDGNASTSTATIDGISCDQFKNSRVADNELQNVDRSITVSNAIGASNDSMFEGNRTRDAAGDYSAAQVTYLDTASDFDEHIEVIKSRLITKDAVTALATVRVQPGEEIEEILIVNTTANAVTGGIKIGTTNGAADVVAAQPVGANALVKIADANILLKIFSTSAIQVLYIQAVTAWNSASLNIRIVVRRLF